MKTKPSSTPPRTGRSAALVTAGILLSRISGFVRVVMFNRAFGLSAEADAFQAAFRIPNSLQNLFGEGALSASFIPVYASLLAHGDKREADRVAGGVAAILALLVAVLVLIGVVATPVFIAVVAPGLEGARRELTTAIVRVLFPGAGMLVMSAWCLGVLNSHHKFLLSYSAGVVWNAAMIATLILYGRSPLPQLAVILAWGSVAGSALQFAVQLPVVLRLANDMRFTINVASEHVRTVFRNFVPVLFSRGVVQISAYIDQVLASLLPTSAIAALASAQQLYTLPVSLFGMSVSAAELPAMSSLVGNDPQGGEAVRQRLNSGLRRIALFVVPSAMAFLALGDVLAAGLFVGGRFTPADAVYVWGLLAGSAVGLLASTVGRLYSSTYFAFRDTRTPLRYALIRVTLTTALGYLFAIPLPRWLHIAPQWGAAGLTASAGIAGWAEMLMLRHTLNSRIGKTGISADYMVKLWSAAAVAAAAGWAAKLLLPPTGPKMTAVLVFGPFGLAYFGAAYLLRVPELSTVLDRVKRLRR